MSPAEGRSSISAAICPISSSPSSRSPSKIPRFGRPRPISASSSSAVAPRLSASSTVRQKPLRTRRVGMAFLSVRIVSPSCTSTHRRLNASQAELSCVSAKRVPSWHPSAPRAKAASMPAPVAMPPAAMSGRSTACRTCGTSAIVVVSSRPLWPPASKPSATTASTPASRLLSANFELDTTCATRQPASCRRPVQVAGLPAEVKTAGTRSSTMTSIS